MSPNVLPFPVHVVTTGNLEEHVAADQPAGKHLKIDIPAFVSMPGNPISLINRSCTRDFKIDPIRRKVRQLLGIAGKRSPTAPACEQWIGISTDEAHRMKPSRERWQKMRWPLIEAGMSRNDCLRWMERKGYPKPAKSSCVFCPYHSNEEWRALTGPEMQRAIRVDERLRSRPPAAYRTKGVLYLHRSGKPLAEVDFRPEAERVGQGDLWGNECEGMCGV